MANPDVSQNQDPTNPLEAPGGVEHVELIVGVGKTALVPKGEATSTMVDYGGYTNFHPRQPGTAYKPGMPLATDVDVNPQTGDPLVPRLK